MSLLAEGKERKEEEYNLLINTRSKSPCFMTPGISESPVVVVHIRAQSVPS